MLVCQLVSSATFEQPEQASTVPVRAIEDRRRPAHGWSRLYVAGLALLGIVILAPAAVAVIREPLHQTVAGVLNIVAGVLFILAAVCVAHNGRRMRMIGWMSISALLTGVILIGLITWRGLAPELQSCVWTDFGASLFFLPLMAPIIAAVWMWMSDPRRIVVAAEKRESAAYHHER